MKKRLAVLILTIIMIAEAASVICRSHSYDAPQVSAKAAILIDADSGQVLLEKNADTRMGMASTTKIMTALTVVSLVSPDMTVTVDKAAVGVEGSSVYLYEGEKLTVEQLLYALLLSSANDAAAALAIFCCGSIEAFADKMNAYASRLGLMNTHFENPHGLYDDDHYTTARDLALIAREAMQSSLLKRIFSTQRMTIPASDGKNFRYLINHNKMLKSYAGACGIKTGFTKKTGRCLVSAAERDGLSLICVTLNAPDDWRDHTAMLDYGYDNFYSYTYADAGELDIEFDCVGATQPTVALTNSEPLVFIAQKGVTPCPEVCVCSPYRFIFAPLAQNEEIGIVTVEYSGITLCSPIVTREEILASEHKKTLWGSLTDMFKDK